MPKDEYIDSATVAQLAGVTVNALRVKRTRTKNRLARALATGGPAKYTPSDVPPPDLEVGSSPLWKRSTIDRWLRDRPDPGLRNRGNR